MPHMLLPPKAPTSLLGAQEAIVSFLLLYIQTINAWNQIHYRGQYLITIGQLPNTVLHNGTVKVFFYFQTAF